MGVKLTDIMKYRQKLKPKLKKKKTGQNGIQMFKVHNINHRQTVRTNYSDAKLGNMQSSISSSCKKNAIADSLPIRKQGQSGIMYSEMLAKFTQNQYTFVQLNSMQLKTKELP